MTGGILYSKSKPCPYKTILIHDRPDVAPYLAGALEDQGYPTVHIFTFEQLFPALEKGLNSFDVALIHKDLWFDGRLFQGCERIIAYLNENNPTIRRGILSGEYPRGVNSVLDMGADFYSWPNKFTQESPFGLLQIQKGPVSSEEVLLRGEKVLTLEGYKTRQQNLKER